MTTRIVQQALVLVLGLAALWSTVLAAEAQLEPRQVGEAWVARYNGPLSGPDWVKDLAVRDG